MQIDPRTVEFLQRQDVQDFLMGNDFKRFYDYARTGQTPVLVGNVTDVLLKAGVDPLKYLRVVPIGYLMYSVATVGVKIPDNIIGIDNYSFRFSHVRGVKIPAGVIEIGHGAFWDCKVLVEITYGGTIAQWNKLVPDREMSFDMDHDIIVYCSDGDLVMQGDGRLNV